MKIGTTELLKFKRLKGRLKLTQWQAIGLLESLWMFTSKNAPAGDIGRCSNEDIAFGIEWDGDPDDLIKVFVDTRWIDESAEHRLVIHDWFDHVPNWLKANFKSHRKTFVGQPPESVEQLAKQPAQASEQPAKSTAEQSTEQLAKQPAQASEQPALGTLPPRHGNSIHDTSSHETGCHGSAIPPSDSLTSEDFALATEEGPIDWASEFADFCEEWQACRQGIGGICIFAGLPHPSMKDSRKTYMLGWNMVISQRDRALFKEVWPKRKKEILQAIKAINDGAIQWEMAALPLHKFVNEINTILGGGHARHKIERQFAQPKPDYKTAQAHSMMSDLEEILSRGVSQPTQQKAISHG